MLKANELIGVRISTLMETVDLISVDVISNVEWFESKMEILLEECRVSLVNNTLMCLPQNSMTSRIA